MQEVYNEEVRVVDIHMPPRDPSALLITDIYDREVLRINEDGTVYYKRIRVWLWVALISSVNLVIASWLANV